MTAINYSITWVGKTYIRILSDFARFKLWCFKKAGSVGVSVRRWLVPSKMVQEMTNGKETDDRIMGFQGLLIITEVKAGPSVLIPQMSNYSTNC